MIDIVELRCLTLSSCQILFLGVLLVDIVQLLELCLSISKGLEEAMLTAQLFAELFEGIAFAEKFLA